MKKKHRLGHLDVDEYNIKMYLSEIGYGYVKWNHLAQSIEHRQAFVDKVTKLQVLQNDWNLSRC